MMPIAEKKDNTLSLTVAFFFFALVNSYSLYRLQFGVNFFDEAFYIAIPYRFFMGQKLFVDEFNIGQTFGLLGYPIVKLHFLFFKSTENIVLTFRLAYWILYLGLGIGLILILKRYIDFAAAVVISGLCSLFLPGGIPSLSYNTLATFFLTLGLFFHLVAYDKRNVVFYFCSGLMLALSAVAYPTFITVVFLVGLLIFLESERKKTFVSFTGGLTAVFLAPAMLVLLRWESVKRCIALAKGAGYSKHKIVSFVEEINKLLPLNVVVFIALMLGILLWLRWQKKLKGSLFCLMLPPMALIMTFLSCGEWHVYSVYLSFLGLVAFYVSPPSPLNRKLFRCVLGPSVFAGAIVVFSSHVGYLNAQVGLLPAAIATLVLVYRGIGKGELNSNLLRLFLIAMPIGFVFIFPFQMWDESPMYQLIERVHTGPYRGIMTSPGKKHYVELVERELQTHFTSKDFILIYPNFGAGYLIAGGVPSPGAIWYSGGKEMDSLLAEDYRRVMTQDSRVLRMNIWFAFPELRTKNTFQKGNPLNDFIEKTHHSVSSSEWFTVFAPNKSNFQTVN